MFIKNLFSFLLIILALAHKKVFYFLYELFFKIKFSSDFKLERLKYERARNSSFLFILENKKTGRKYFFKKQNPFSRLYDLVFLSYGRMSDRALYYEIQNLSGSSPVSSIAPTMILFKKYLLTEYLDDNNHARLDDYLSANKQDKGKVERVREKIFSGVRELKRAGYVHGDIKAQNIYIEKNNGEVKIIDWDGLRKLTPHEESLDESKLSPIFEGLL